MGRVPSLLALLQPGVGGEVWEGSLEEVASELNIEG